MTSLDELVLRTKSPVSEPVSQSFDMRKWHAFGSKQLTSHACLLLKPCRLPNTRAFGIARELLRLGVGELLQLLQLLGPGLQVEHLEARRAARREDDLV